MNVCLFGIFEVDVIRAYRSQQWDTYRLIPSITKVPPYLAEEHQCTRIPQANIGNNKGPDISALSDAMVFFVVSSNILLYIAERIAERSVNKTS